MLPTIGLSHLLISTAMWEAILIISSFLSILSIIGVIITENSNPVKTIAWVVVLIFIPVFGLILYLFFGQEYSRQKHLSRKLLRKIRHTLPFKPTILPKANISYDQMPLAKMLSSHELSNIYGGSSVEIFTKGYDKVEHLLNSLNQATHHIHMLYYIFSDDEIGNKVKSVLIEKAQQGIEVRLIVDDVGCWKNKRSFFNEMTQAGVLVEVFLKVNLRITKNKINYRNHRKIVVIDGNIGYIGGMNLADRYVYGNHLGAWRDTHIAVTGPAVYGLQAAFMTDWYTPKKAIPEMTNYFPPLEETGNVSAQIVTDNPFMGENRMKEAFLKIILTAKKYLYIQTPYFLPSESLILALKSAVRSGVDVRLIVPGRSDSKIVGYASMSFIKLVLQAGVKVYQYQEGFIHSKLIVCDDHLTVVGSTNWDFRSLEHNFESNIFLYSEETAKKMREIYKNDLKSTTRLDLFSYKKMGRWARLRNMTLRLFSPLF